MNAKTNKELFFQQGKVQQGAMAALMRQTLSPITKQNAV